MVSSSEYTINTLTCSFGFPIFNETNGTNYKNQKGKNYETNAYWKSLLVYISGPGRIGMIDEIRLNFEKLVSGNALNVKIVNDKGKVLFDKDISYANDGDITSKFFFTSLKTENFRIELDWSNNSSTVPFKIKNIYILGHTLK
jgi:hypothetical protein